MLFGAELPGAVPGLGTAPGHGTAGNLTADWTHRFCSAAPITRPQVPQNRPRQVYSKADLHTLFHYRQEKLADLSS